MTQENHNQISDLLQLARQRGYLLLEEMKRREKQRGKEARRNQKKMEKRAKDEAEKQGSVPVADPQLESPAQKTAL